jgi:molybdate transport system ATP-binding protein
VRLTVDVRARRGTFVVEAAFDAEPGHTLALLGPNGAGKSTLVEVLAGLLPPEAGTVKLDSTTLDDVDGNVHAEPATRPVGVVFQGLLLFPHLSAVENVAFPLRARRIPRPQARLRAAKLLTDLGVTDRASARPRDLSGGEAQRVALARALVAEPKLLLLDEPLSALDVRARTQTRALLHKALAEFPGVRLLVTHDPVEAMTLADRMILLEDGSVTQIGTALEIRTAPRTRYAADLVGVNFFEGRLERLDESAGRIVTPVGEVAVAWPEGPEAMGESVIGILRPADVVLHTARPEGSARNVLQGSISHIAVESERARVHVESSPPIIAEVTLGSIERLELREGTHVWASFKAVEVRVLPP